MGVGIPRPPGPALGASEGDGSLDDRDWFGGWRSFPRWFAVHYKIPAIRLLGLVVDCALGDCNVRAPAFCIEGLEDTKEKHARTGPACVTVGVPWLVA